jgi:hypothetical protein
MAKIDVINNNMAMFMLCEAIGSERKEWEDLKADENGLYDVKIFLNGKEINVERFIDNLYRSYKDAVKRQAADLLELEYSKMLNNIYEIQEALEHHEKIFEDKVFGR